MRSDELINFGSKFLKKSSILTNRIDSEILLSYVVGVPREKLLISEKFIKHKEIEKFRHLILRRSKNEPIAYITENKEFRSKNFFINKDSLIPRPETELLIDPILKIFANKNLFFLDAGIGSGCITFSILNELKNSRAIGIDISKKTLSNAKKNLKKFKNRVKIFCKPIDEIRNLRFDLIVSNPPYIVKREVKRLSNDIKKFEPIVALDGGNDGLDVIKKVIYKSKYILKSDGILALEIGNGQYSSVMKLLKVNNFRKKILVRDYRNNIRCIFSTL
mgnify:CR=1 FL=1